MDITNATQLQGALADIASKTIERVSKDSLARLKMLIMMYTYTWDYFPNKNYYNGKRMPTFQFLNAFKWGGIRTSFWSNTKTVENVLSYDWHSMRFDAKTYLHGSYKYGDMRENLAMLLNVDGVAEGGVGAKERKPYWDNFIEESFTENGGWSLTQLFLKHFGRYGLVYRG